MGALNSDRHNCLRLVAVLEKQAWLIIRGISLGRLKIWRRRLLDSACKYGSASAVGNSMVLDVMQTSFSRREILGMYSES